MDPSLLIQSCATKRSRNSLQIPRHSVASDLLNVVRKRIPDAPQVLKFLAFAILNATGKHQCNILAFRVSSVQVTYVTSSVNIVHTVLASNLPNHFLLVASPANHSRLSMSARKLP